MRPVTIAYLPALNDPRFNARAFVQNLQDHPPAGDLILFSDHDHASTPGVIKLKKTVDLPSLREAKIIRPGTGESVDNKAAVNNLIFLTALRIVESQGYTHFCYLEADCRVKGPSWDQRIFNEFKASPRHLLAAGSVVIYNPFNHCLATARRYEQFLDETESAGRRMPIPTYGWLAAADGKGCNLFVNGAGGVYSVAGLNLLFPERGPHGDPNLAASIWAWDFAIGLRLWKQFGPGVFEIVGYLNSVFSSYGNVLTTEAERLAMLDDGFVLIHQAKSMEKK